MGKKDKQNKIIRGIIKIFGLVILIMILIVVVLIIIQCVAVLNDNDYYEEEETEELPPYKTHFGRKFKNQRGLKYLFL